MPDPLLPSINLWVEKDGQVALSRWRVRLLQAIDETGSIRAAAARMDVAYSLAWRRVDEMEAALGARLVERQKGGLRGGQASLTPQGHAYVEQFTRWAQQVDAEIARRYQEAFGDE